MTERGRVSYSSFGYFYVLIRRSIVHGIAIIAAMGALPERLAVARAWKRAIGETDDGFVIFCGFVIIGTGLVDLVTELQRGDFDRILNG